MSKGELLASSRFEDQSQVQSSVNFCLEIQFLPICEVKSGYDLIW